MVAALASKGPPDDQPHRHPAHDPLRRLATAEPLILPLPERLKGGAAHKVVRALMTRGLIEEVEAVRGEPVWRATGDDLGVTLVATDAAFAALGTARPRAPRRRRPNRREETGPAEEGGPRAARRGGLRARAGTAASRPS